jgi:hypothetical protein
VAITAQELRSTGVVTSDDESPDIYCKVYVYFEQEPEYLVLLVQQITQGAIFLRSVEGGPLEIDIVKNDERDDWRSRSFPDGFLFFPYYLDVSPSPDTGRATFISAVAKLLQQLWSRGIPAVASSDFESELPSAGGYKCRECPWPGKS